MLNKKHVSISAHSRLSACPTNLERGNLRHRTQQLGDVILTVEYLRTHTHTFSKFIVIISFAKLPWLHFSGSLLQVYGDDSVGNGD